MIKSVLTGTCVGLLILAAGCAAASACISRQILPEGAIRYCAWAISALSAFACCMTAQRQGGGGSLPVSLACALLLLLCMLLLRLAVTDGGKWSWHGAFIPVAAALAAAFLRAGGRNRRR